MLSSIAALKVVCLCLRSVYCAWPTLCYMPAWSFAQFDHAFRRMMKRVRGAALTIAVITYVPHAYRRTVKPSVFIMLFFVLCKSSAFVIHFLCCLLSLAAPFWVVNTCFRVQDIWKEWQKLLSKIIIKYPISGPWARLLFVLIK